MAQLCYCGSSIPFADCCEPFLKGTKMATSAEKLMRSRYSAYATQAVDYLLSTTHISQRKFYSKSDILNWSESNQWVKLEILNASENEVEFKAYYIDSELRAQIHHEKSTFVQENGVWYYFDGTFH